MSEQTNHKIGKVVAAGDFMIGLCFCLLPMRFASPANFIAFAVTSIMPSATFFLLGGALLIESFHNQTRSLIGASAGATLAFTFPYIVLYASILQGDLTPNIGAGIILLTSPCYAPFLIAGGWVIGIAFQKH